MINKNYKDFIKKLKEEVSNTKEELEKLEPLPGKIFDPETNRIYDPSNKSIGEIAKEYPKATPIPDEKLFEQFEDLREAFERQRIEAKEVLEEIKNNPSPFWKNREKPKIPEEVIELSQKIKFRTYEEMMKKYPETKNLDWDEFQKKYKKGFDNLSKEMSQKVIEELYKEIEISKNEIRAIERATEPFNIIKVPKKLLKEKLIAFPHYYEMKLIEEKTVSQGTKKRMEYKYKTTDRKVRYIQEMPIEEDSTNFSIYNERIFLASLLYAYVENTIIDVIMPVGQLIRLIGGKRKLYEALDSVCNNLKNGRWEVETDDYYLNTSLWGEWGRYGKGKSQYIKVNITPRYAEPTQYFIDKSGKLPGELRTLEDETGDPNYEDNPEKGKIPSYVNYPIDALALQTESRKFRLVDYVRTLKLPSYAIFVKTLLSKMGCDLEREPGKLISELSLGLEETKKWGYTFEILNQSFSDFKNAFSPGIIQSLTKESIESSYFMSIKDHFKSLKGILKDKPNLYTYKKSFLNLSVIFHD